MSKPITKEQQDALKAQWADIAFQIADHQQAIQRLQQQAQTIETQIRSSTVKEGK